MLKASPQKKKLFAMGELQLTITATTATIE